MSVDNAAVGPVVISVKLGGFAGNPFPSCNTVVDTGCIHTLKLFQSLVCVTVNRPIMQKSNPQCDENGRMENESC